MDTKELLASVIDSVVSEDDVKAAEAFGQYATLKMKDLVEAKTTDGFGEG